MRTGHNGCIAISWAQTELDGLENAPLSFLKVGAAWSWRGRAIVFDTQGDLGARPSSNTVDDFLNQHELASDAHGVVILTNGAQQFSALLYSASERTEPVLVFEGACPAREQEFWVDEVVEIQTGSDEIERAPDTVIAFPARPNMDPDIHAVPRLPAANSGPLMD